MKIVIINNIQATVTATCQFSIYGYTQIVSVGGQIRGGTSESIWAEVVFSHCSLGRESCLRGLYIQRVYNRGQPLLTGSVLVTTGGSGKVILLVGERSGKKTCLILR